MHARRCDLACHSTRRASSAVRLHLESWFENGRTQQRLWPERHRGGVDGGAAAAGAGAAVELEAAALGSAAAAAARRCARSLRSHSSS